MRLFLELVLNSIHIMRFIILCSYFVVLPKRENKYLKYVPIVLTLGTTILFEICSDINVRCFIYYLCIIGIITSLYRVTGWKIPILAIWSMCLIEMFSQISNIFVGAVYRIWSIADVYRIRELTEQLLALFITVLMCAVVYRKNRQGIRSLNVPTIVFFTIVCAANVVVLLLMTLFTQNLNIGQRIVFAIVFLLIVIGILAQIALLIWSMVARNNLVENENLLKKYLEHQQEHYEYLEKRETETKKFRHDLKNHMYVLQNLFDNQDEEEIQKYLQKMNQQIEQFGSRISVNYNIADAILNKYTSMAEDYGVHMQVSGKFPLNCEISAYDLCTILSNVLSNAVEAAGQCEEGWLKAEFAYDEQDVIIIVQNNYEGELLYENGNIQTKKQDKHNHGIGLNNMITAVENNGGDFDIQIENQTFRVRVFLKYIQKNQEGV